MNKQPTIHRFPHRTAIDGVQVESIVVHPEGGKYALDTVEVTWPGRDTIRLKPRTHSHETLEGIDNEVRTIVADLNRS